MLQNMHIKNIALIDDIEISFDDKLNILTGETGAGKSIIIGSLGICLGGRFSKEILRDSQSDGLVELLFSIENNNILEQLTELDIECEDGEILISRRLASNGKAVSKINGSIVTSAELKQVSALLIDLHAQHEQQSLLKENKHLAILDRFGGSAIAEESLKVKELYKAYSELKTKLKEATEDEAEKNKTLDFLKYQISEIEAAALKPGEDEALEAFYRKIVNSKELIQTAVEISQLTGDAIGASGDMLGRAVNLMKRMNDLDDGLSGAYETIINIDDLLRDFNRELEEYIRKMEFDESEFIQTESRLNTINSLKAKYGKTIDEVLNSKKNYEEEYKRLVHFDEYITDLKIKLKETEEKLRKHCESLSVLRKESAKKLCTLIKDALIELNFMSVQFDMSFRQTASFTASGIDEACFLISTNVGEPMRPLSEVASGGELSRVMLAIKSCLADEDDTPTLIFDEIDVGISGRTAQKVAERLSIIARKHQVICITHLPQIAAMADSNYLIEKIVVNNKTNTKIRKIKNQEVLEEIARLLGGAEITDVTRSSAAEMKGLADRTKLY
ncbi:MAG: DNA repair protein RecN [Wujia sp.]